MSDNIDIICTEPEFHDDHLCQVKGEHSEKCDWCGSIITNKRHLCSKKVKELSYICNSCGRAAISPKDLCDPKKIE